MFFKLLLLPLSTNQIILPLTLNFNDIREITKIRKKEVANSTGIDKRHIEMILDENDPGYLVGIQPRFKTSTLKTDLNVDMTCIIADNEGSKLS